MDSLIKKDFRFTMKVPPNMPNVGPFYLDLLCSFYRELTDFSIYVGRSLGIPCAIDFLPMRGDVNEVTFTLNWKIEEASLNIHYSLNCSWDM